MLLSEVEVLTKIVVGYRVPGLFGCILNLRTPLAPHNKPHTLKLPNRDPKFQGEGWAVGMGLTSPWIDASEAWPRMGARDMSSECFVGIARLYHGPQM